MWKMTVMTLAKNENSLLKQYAETGGADSELMEILRIAYSLGERSHCLESHSI